MNAETSNATHDCRALAAPWSQCDDQCEWGHLCPTWILSDGGLPCEDCGQPTDRVMRGPDQESVTRCVLCAGNLRRDALQAEHDDQPACDGCGEWTAEGAPCACGPDHDCRATGCDDDCEACCA